jgi:hypothetical protein
MRREMRCKRFLLLTIVADSAKVTFVGKYQRLIQALETTVAAAHAVGLPHIAGQLYAVRDIQNERGVTLLEDRLLTVSKLLQLRRIPSSKVPKLAEAAMGLAQAIREARYI